MTDAGQDGAVLLFNFGRVGAGDDRPHQALGRHHEQRFLVGARGVQYGVAARVVGRGPPIKREDVFPVVLRPHHVDVEVGHEIEPSALHVVLEEIDPPVARVVLPVGPGGCRRVDDHVGTVANQVERGVDRHQVAPVISAPEVLAGGNSQVEGSPTTTHLHGERLQQAPKRGRREVFGGIPRGEEVAAVVEHPVGRQQRLGLQAGW